ncbi:MAG TPA: hypothetical protein DCP92_08050 [Nitrospiraceae bacterium]|nr:hypothetical protein [Nitrospiraceae bacterium]
MLQLGNAFFLCFEKMGKFRLFCIQNSPSQLKRFPSLSVVIKLWNMADEDIAEQLKTALEECAS